MKTPLEELKDAVEKLIVLTKEQESALKRFPKREEIFSSSVKEFTYWVKTALFGWWFSTKVQGSTQHKIRQSERLRVVDVIKSHYLLIETFEKGSQEEVKLAQLASSAIAQHNRLIEEAQKLPFAKKHLATIDELIALPRKATHKVTSIAGITSTIAIEAMIPQSKGNKHSSLKIDKLKSSISGNVENNTHDLFRMKAIRTLNEKGLLPQSITYSSVHQTPIQQISKTNEEEAISLGQTLKPFPGEEIQFLADYDKLHPTGKFSYALSSSQTGFPNPLLSWGWALSETLMPQYPIHLSLLPHYQELLDKKMEVAHALLPDGKLNGPAKKLFSLKKRVFEKNPEPLISLHETFFFKLLPQPLHKEISDYFYSLRMTHPSYEEFCAPYQRINETYLEAMQKTVVKGWSTGNDKELSSSSSQVRRLRVEQLLLGALPKSSQNGSLQDRFVELVGSFFAKECTPLFLQSFSEIFKFSPPALSDRQIQIQTILFHQQIAFFSQLESPLPSPEMLLEWEIEDATTQQALLEDKALNFLAEKSQTLVYELEAYYNHQYFSR